MDKKTRATTAVRDVIGYYDLCLLTGVYKLAVRASGCATLIGGPKLIHVLLERRHVRKS
jgi:hypothetical protein